MIQELCLARKYSQIFCFLVCFLVFSQAAQADIQEVQALSFGKLVILSNSEVETIRIDKAGNITYSDVFRIIESPARARFRLFNLPVNTPVNISTLIVQSTLSAESPNLERFTFDELDHLKLVITDGSGEATVWVGGQISTSGLGPILYGDSVPFTANYRFTIDF